MSRHVDGLRYEPATENLYITRAGARGPDPWEMMPQKVPANELSNAVGKELAEKLLAQPKEQWKQGTGTPAIVHTLNDLGSVKIGGEGHKGFYGDFSPDGSYTPGIVGTRLLKLLKGLDPEAKIEGHDVVQSKGGPLSGRELPEIKSHYPSVPITKAMRDKILKEGLPLFVNRDPLTGMLAASAAERAGVPELPSAAASRMEAHGQGQGVSGEAGRAAGAGAQAGELPGPGAVSGSRSELAPQSGPRDPYAAIPGIPRSVKIPGYGDVDAAPVPWLVDAGNAFLGKAGRTHALPEAFGPLDEARAKRIAEAYEAMQHDPTNPDVRRSYEALADETLGQYKALKDAGAEFHFNEPGQDPYAASPAMGYPELRDKRSLSVFPTAEGYGNQFTASELENNPLLKGSGEKFGDRPALMNDLFRAVHDSYGHYAYGNPFFRAPGEERAWMIHSGMYGPEARGAMTTELRGQNSWLNHGPHAEHNRTASAADTVFAPQKMGLLPEWAQEEGRSGITSEQARKRGILFSNPDEAAPLGLAVAEAGEGAPELPSAAKRPSLNTAPFPKPGRLENLVDDYAKPREGLPSTLDYESYFNSEPTTVGIPHDWPAPTKMPARDANQPIKNLRHPKTRDRLARQAMPNLFEGPGGDLVNPWYDPAPLLKKWEDIYGPEHGSDMLGKYLDFVGATSPLTEVGQNIREASRAYNLWHEGKPFNEFSLGPDLSGPASKVKQKLARDVATDTPFDPETAPKVANFRANLRGAGTKEVDYTPEGERKITPMTLDSVMASTWPYRTKTGDPALFKRSAYGAGVEAGHDLADRLGGVPGADWQAAVWQGHQKGIHADTSYGARYNDSFARQVETAVQRTAQQEGIDPELVWEKFITGKMRLFSNPEEAAPVGMALAGAGDNAPELPLGLPPLPPKPSRLPPVSMDKASREGRAKMLGFRPEIWRHGTTKKFKEFADPNDPKNIATRDNPLGLYESESYHGPGVYLTSDLHDANRNYQYGNDLRARQELTEERLLENSSLHPDIISDRARKFLRGKAPRTLNLRTRAENPVHVGDAAYPNNLPDTRFGSQRAWVYEDPGNERYTVFYGDDKQPIKSFGTPDEAYEFADEIPPKGRANDLIDSFAERTKNRWGRDDTLGKLRTYLAENDAIPASSFERIVRNADIEGDALGKVIQDTYRDLGHDSIIFHNAWDRFRGMGLPEGTKHMVVFEPNKLRDVKARYHPLYKDSANLLYGNAPEGAPGALSAADHEDDDMDPIQRAIVERALRAVGHKQH